MNSLDIMTGVAGGIMLCVPWLWGLAQLHKSDKDKSEPSLWVYAAVAGPMIWVGTGLYLASH